MKIAVIGAGAIGNLVAGYLRLEGQEVFLVGHADSVKAIKEGGLRISGARGDFNIKIDAADKLNSPPELVILTTKTQDIDSAIRVNLEFIQEAAILTTQNGVHADNIVARYIPKEKIISSIVMFGGTYLEPGRVVHNFEGSWIIGSLFGKNEAKVEEVSGILNKVFPTLVAEDIRGMKYLKIFINANNCLPAILGESMQDVFSDITVSRISIAIWQEGLNIVSHAGIKPVSLPDFPLERLAKLTSLPLEEAARIFSGIMTGLSQEPLYGSILQSIKRGRDSEIDYINGEFVRLAEENNLEAPLNKKLVKMVHDVEKTKRFFTKEELLRQIKGIAG